MTSETTTVTIADVHETIHQLLQLPEIAARKFYIDIFDPMLRMKEEDRYRERLGYQIEEFIYQYKHKKYMPPFNELMDKLEQQGQELFKRLAEPPKEELAELDLGKIKSTVWFPKAICNRMKDKYPDLMRNWKSLVFDYSFQDWKHVLLAEQGFNWVSQFFLKVNTIKIKYREMNKSYTFKPKREIVISVIKDDRAEWEDEIKKHHQWEIDYLDLVSGRYKQGEIVWNSLKE